jgi:hypothetical protein
MDGQRMLQFDVDEVESEFEEEETQQESQSQSESQEELRDEDEQADDEDDDTRDSPLKGMNKKDKLKLFEKEFFKARMEELLWKPPKDPESTQAHMVPTLSKSSILILGMLIAMCVAQILQLNSLCFA